MMNISVFGTFPEKLLWTEGYTNTQKYDIIVKTEVHEHEEV